MFAYINQVVDGVLILISTGKIGVYTGYTKFSLLNAQREFSRLVGVMLAGTQIETPR